MHWSEAKLWRMPTPSSARALHKKTAFLTAEMTNIEQSPHTVRYHKYLIKRREKGIGFLFKSRMDKLTYGISIDERYHFLMTKYRITS